MKKKRKQHSKQHTNIYLLMNYLDSEAFIFHSFHSFINYTSLQHFLFTLRLSCSRSPLLCLYTRKSKVRSLLSLASRFMHLYITQLVIVSYDSHFSYTVQAPATKGLSSTLNIYTNLSIFFLSSVQRFLYL